MNTETPVSTQETLQPTSTSVRRWAVPPLDVLEKDGDLRLVVDVPGVAADGLTVEAHAGTLTITGRRADRPDHGWRRTVRLPDQVDASGIVASLRHGVLTLTLPRAEAAKPRKIEVRTA